MLAKPSKPVTCRLLRSQEKICDLRARSESLLVTVLQTDGFLGQNALMQVGPDLEILVLALTWHTQHDRYHKEWFRVRTRWIKGLRV